MKISILILALLVLSCKKKGMDDAILIKNPGLPYYDCNCPIPQLNLGEVVTGNPDDFAELDDDTQYFGPHFNPNDPNEIMYVTHSNVGQHIVRYHLLTHEKQVVAEPLNVQYLTWGKNDWVIFMEGLTTYKMKSNGDSLTSFGNSSWYDAKFNAAGDKYVVSIQGKRYRLIKNMEGETIGIIDNPEWHLESNNWSHPQYYLTFDNQHIKIIDLENNQLIKHIKTPFVDQTTQLHRFTFTTWKSSTELMFTFLGGTYTYNIETDEFKYISCDCRWLNGRGTHAGDFSNLIFKKTYRRINSDSTKYIVDNKLFLIDPHTFEEVEIIP